MKILVVASTLDLAYRLGCTPAWWQFLKAFHETGHEVIAIPYLGDPVETPWWRTYPNPCSRESRLFNAVSKNKGLDAKRGPSKVLGEQLILHHIRPKWRRHLRAVLKEEKDVDLLLFLNVPLNHLTGIVSEMKAEFGIKAAYYDGDMPTILPDHALVRGFKFSYYEGADLTEFDAFFSNSKGVIPQLEALGARNVYPLYYAADPELFQPTRAPPDADVGFYGHGDDLREQWMGSLIRDASLALSDRKFIVGGTGFRIPLGRAELVGPVPFARFGRFIARSRVNLNITRTSHTSVYASATARPFELAAYGACIVSQPYLGLEEWFEPGEEVILLTESDDATNVIRTILEDEVRQQELGARARERLVRSHTYRHRVEEVQRVLSLNA